MNILLKGNLPYLMTILIGLTAYQFNNIISIHADSPLLVYQFERIESENIDGQVKNKLECTIVNYSKKQAIKDIKIHISYRSKLPNPKKVVNPNIIPVAPSAILADTMTNAAFGLINEYKIPIIHPSAEYILTLETTANPLIKEYPKLYLYSNESIRLIENNFEVYLIRHQIAINVFLLLVWVSFAIFYLFYLSKLSRKEAGVEK